MNSDWSGNTEIIDRLFLELSLVTSATTKKERALLLENFELRKQVKDLKEMVKDLKKEVKGE
jgi:hypothetical protein